MIAARKRTFEKLEVLYADNMCEKPEANTRLLICTAIAHYPIPRLGEEIIIFAMHGNNKKMKCSTSVKTHFSMAHPKTET